MNWLKVVMYAPFRHVVKSRFPAVSYFEGRGDLKTGTVMGHKETGQQMILIVLRSGVIHFVLDSALAVAEETSGLEMVQKLRAGFLLDEALEYDASPSELARPQVASTAFSDDLYAVSQD